MLSLFLSPPSFFFYRAKYFQGKKVNGEFEIRVEQVSEEKSSAGI